MISRDSKIDAGTIIWHEELVNIYGNCRIGTDCNIGAFVEIGPEVIIGHKVRIGAHCFIPEGVTIGNYCFIGPGCVFTNDRYPPSPKEEWEKTTVKSGAKIGAGCVILPGVIIGEGAIIGAGTIVTKNVPDGWKVIGNPMRRITDDHRGNANIGW